VGALLIVASVSMDIVLFFSCRNVKEYEENRRREEEEKGL